MDDSVVPYNSGHGGAGGTYALFNNSLGEGTYTITIGAGGSRPSNGSSTTLSGNSLTYTGTGGGRGGPTSYSAIQGYSGGCGGGSNGGFNSSGGLGANGAGGVTGFNGGAGNGLQGGSSAGGGGGGYAGVGPIGRAFAAPEPRAPGISSGIITGARGGFVNSGPASANSGDGGQSGYAGGSGFVAIRYLKTAVA